jgi:hypothetical protein
MYEALCRPFGTTLDIVHDEGRPPITPRTWGLGLETSYDFTTLAKLLDDFEAEIVAIRGKPI